MLQKLCDKIRDSHVITDFGDGGAVAAAVAGAISDVRRI